MPDAEPDINEENMDEGLSSEPRSVGDFDDHSSAHVERFQSQYGSLAEVAQQNGGQELGEKVASSTGESVLKRDTGELVNKDENGNETIITEEHNSAVGKISQELRSQGFSIIEFQKPDSETLVSVVYFADAKGHVSYDVYNREIEQVDASDDAPDSEGLIIESLGLGQVELSDSEDPEPVVITEVPLVIDLNQHFESDDFSDDAEPASTRLAPDLSSLGGPVMQTVVVPVRLNAVEPAVASLQEILAVQETEDWDDFVDDWQPVVEVAVMPVRLTANQVEVVAVQDEAETIPLRSEEEVTPPVFESSGITLVITEEIPEPLMVEAEDTVLSEEALEIAGIEPVLIDLSQGGPELVEAPVILKVNAIENKIPEPVIEDPFNVVQIPKIEEPLYFFEISRVILEPVQLQGRTLTEIPVAPVTKVIFESQELFEAVIAEPEIRVLDLVQPEVLHFSEPVRERAALERSVVEEELFAMVVPASSADRTGERSVVVEPQVFDQIASEPWVRLAPETIQVVAEHFEQPKEPVNNILVFDRAIARAQIRQVEVPAVQSEPSVVVRDETPTAKTVVLFEAEREVQLEPTVLANSKPDSETPVIIVGEKIELVTSVVSEPVIILEPKPQEARLPESDLSEVIEAVGYAQSQPRVSETRRVVDFPPQQARVFDRNPVNRAVPNFETQRQASRASAPISADEGLDLEDLLPVRLAEQAA